MTFNFAEGISKFSIVLPLLKLLGLMKSDHPYSFEQKGRQRF